MLIAGCVQEQTKNESSDNGTGAEVACPTDAKLCPDGSSLSRVPPECAFPECPETGLAVPKVVDQNADIQFSSYIVNGNVSNLGTKTGDAIVTVTLFTSSKKEITKKTTTITSIHPEEKKPFTVKFDMTHDEIIEVSMYTAVASRVT